MKKMQPIRITKFRYNNKTKNKYNLINILDLSTKLITVIPFLLICFGSSQLFIFSISHNAYFIDLLKFNVLLSFGAINIILISFMVYIFSMVTLYNHFLSGIVNKELIGKSNFEIIRKNPTITLIIFSLILGSWPLTFLIPSENKNPWLILIFYSLSLVTALLYYQNFFTKSFYDNSNPKAIKIIQRFKVVLFSLVPFIAMSVALTFYLTFDDFFKKEKTQDYIVLISTSCLLAFINLLSFYLPRSEKKGTFPTATLLLTSILFVLLLLPSDFSDYQVNNLVKKIGLGLGKRCFIKKEIDKLSIPRIFKREEENIVELSVVINIDNIYYLSYPDDDDFKSRIRFIAADLTRVGCPDNRVPMAQNQM